MRGRPPGVVDGQEAEGDGEGHGLAVVEFGVGGPVGVEDVGGAVVEVEGAEGVGEGGEGEGEAGGGGGVGHGSGGGGVVGWVGLGWSGVVG